MTMAMTVTGDEAKLGELIRGFATDVAACLHPPTAATGDRLGLYRAVPEAGPVRGADLPAHTGYDRRLVEEWLNAQCVSGYCEHDPEAGTFWLTPEQAAVLAD